MRMRWIPITKFISNLGLYEGPTGFLRPRLAGPAASGKKPPVG